MNAGRPILVITLLSFVLCCAVAQISTDVTAVGTTKQITTLAGTTPSLATTARYSNFGTYFSNGWRYYEASTIPLPWSAAKYECRRKGMNLVSIETREEDEFIRQHLFVNYPNEHFWTSGNDVFQEGYYYWDSTGNAVGPYRNWAPNHPVASTLYNCIVYSRGADLRWAIASCSDQYRFICEQNY
ncbi:galactose-specific lectin nattectin-like [Cloeon dipterum]|uniref:galactose-specific lectin nattectin-like n=1 Tax=Cloeon dipterum TaxID=197152 RepID=UPI0032206FDA